MIGVIGGIGEIEEPAGADTETDSRYADRHLGASRSRYGKGREETEGHAGDRPALRGTEEQIRKIT